MSLPPLTSIPAALALAAPPAPAGPAQPLVPVDGGAVVVAPTVILICCAVAALATWLILPKRWPMQNVLTKVGGISLLVAFVVLVGNVLNHTSAYLAERGTEAGGFGLLAMGPYFWIFSVLALAASVRVITHPKPVYSALWFVLTIFASAGLFILLSAEFMAAALVTIYAGAILVTYTFVIMLAADAGPERADVDPSGAVAEYAPDHDASSRGPLTAAATGFVIGGLILYAVFARAPAVLPQNGPLAVRPYLPALRGEGAALTGVGAVPPDAAPLVAGQTQELGVYLLANQAVALQAAGLILTVAMIGAIVIARRPIWRPAADRRVEHKPGDKPYAGMVSTPATPIDDNPHSLPVRGSQNPRQKAYPQT